MFQMAHTWKIQPSEFWDMTIPEWFALFELHQPSNNAGKLNNADVDELFDIAQMSDEEWNEKHGPTRR